MNSKPALLGPARSPLATVLRTELVFSITLMMLGLQFLSPTTIWAEEEVEKGIKDDPSILVPDDDGVLWFKKGNDYSTPLVEAVRLSSRKPFFVVFVSTTSTHREKAVAHAKTLAKWFEDHPQTPEYVPVLAYESNRATYFAYYMNGVHYRHEELAPKGIMGPQESFKLRQDAIITFRASETIRQREKLSQTVTVDQTNRNRD